MEITTSTGYTYIVKFCCNYENPILIFNKTTLLPINYKTTSKNIQKTIIIQFIKYLKNLTFPLDMNPEVALYTQSPFLKKQLTLEQTNIIMKCLEKEARHLDTNPKDIPLIDKTIVIAESSQSGKTLISLEMSAHNIDRDGVIQSTLIVVPRTNISSWKLKLSHCYNEKYIIIDHIDKLESLLIYSTDTNIKDTEELRTIMRRYYLSTDKVFDKSIISSNKLYIISSHLFDKFQYYAEITNIVFARLFYDSIYNINDVHALFDNTYIYVYLMTNNRTIFPIYGNTLSYNYINNNVIKTKCVLSMYFKFLKDVFIETELNYKLLTLKNDVVTCVIKIRNIKETLNITDEEPIINEEITNLVKQIKEREDLITKYEGLIYYTKNKIKETFLFNNTQTQIQYQDIITHEIIFNLNNNSLKSFIVKCFINKDYNHLIQYLQLYKLDTAQLYLNIGLDHSNRESIINRIEESINCPICFETIECPLITKCCYNVFCLHCYLKSHLAKPNSCPCCRKVIDIKTHCVLEDRIPSEKNLEYTLDIIKENSLDLNNVDNFKMIIKYIVSKSLNPKIMIIINDPNKYFTSINSMLISEELNSVYYRNNCSHASYEEQHMKSLDDFNKTMLIDCIVMHEESYINFIEMGYTLIRLDYIINYDSDLIFEAHSLPKIIKRNKIQDNVTTCIDLQSM